jgi:hypothetical protein
MNFVTVQELGTIFAKVKARFHEQIPSDLVCRQGIYKNCCVLKLQKSSWTNDSMKEIQNQSGIFFSVWSNEESLRRKRVMYNIHALKLRQLKDYTITSRDFAGEFRKNFISERGDWPNVRTDYGPATLMQGWIESTPTVLSERVYALMKSFVRLSSFIDRLLDSRRRQ